MKTRLVASSRHIWLIRVTTLVCVVALPALTHAHGAMGPDELGPPLGTAGLLGFVSYWVVMLWPSTKKKAQKLAGSNNGSPTSDVAARPRRRKTPRTKRIPHLRKIAPGVQLPGDQPERRKASDG
jgi:hypothetical protein